MEGRRTKQQQTLEPGSTAAPFGNAAEIVHHQSSVDSAPRAQTRLERIATRAYEIYETRGGTDGRALDDWLRAEQEIDGTSNREAETAGGS